MTTELATLQSKGKEVNLSVYDFVLMKECIISVKKTPILPNIEKTSDEQQKFLPFSKPECEVSEV